MHRRLDKRFNDSQFFFHLCENPSLTFYNIPNIRRHSIYQSDDLVKLKNRSWYLWPADAILEMVKYPNLAFKTPICDTMTVTGIFTLETTDFMFTFFFFIYLKGNYTDNDKIMFATTDKALIKVSIVTMFYLSSCSSFQSLLVFFAFKSLSSPVDHNQRIWRKSIE